MQLTFGIHWCHKKYWSLNGRLRYFHFNQDEDTYYDEDGGESIRLIWSSIRILWLVINWGIEEEL